MSWDLFICFDCHRAPACVSHFIEVPWLDLHFSIHSHLFCALYSNKCLLIHWLDVHHILKCRLKNRSVYRKHVGIVSRFCFARVTIWNYLLLSLGGRMGSIPAGKNNVKEEGGKTEKYLAIGDSFHWEPKWYGKRINIVGVVLCHVLILFRHCFSFGHSTHICSWSLKPFFERWGWVKVSFSGCWFYFFFFFF